MPFFGFAPLSLSLSPLSPSFVFLPIPHRAQVHLGAPAAAAARGLEEGAQGPRRRRGRGIVDGALAAARSRHRRCCCSFRFRRRGAGREGGYADCARLQRHLRRHEKWSEKRGLSPLFLSVSRKKVREKRKAGRVMMVGRRRSKRREKKNSLASQFETSEAADQNAESSERLLLFFFYFSIRTNREQERGSSSSSSSSSKLIWSRN